MWLKRYKEGFDRLAIVLFVAVAVCFGLIHLMVSETYIAPAPESAEGRALVAEVERKCSVEERAVFVFLCREEVTARRRLTHYRDRLGSSQAGFLVLIAAAGLVSALGYRAYRWVRVGFTQK